MNILKERFKNRNKKSNNTKYIDLTKYFYTIENSLKATLESKTINSILLLSEGGFGKSTQVEKVLKENKTTYKIIKGYSTPLQLYHILYEHKDKVIVFDDCDSLFQNKRAVSLLKSAMDTKDNRIVQYNTTSKQLDAKPEFIFNGKIIICANDIPDNRDVRAVLSRCYIPDIRFNYNTKLEIIKVILHSPYHTLTTTDRKIIWRFVKKYSNEATIINLRTIRKLQDLYLYCKKHRKDFEKVAMNELPMDENLKYYYEAMSQKSLTMRQRVIFFTTLSGLSRATFYRIHRKVSKSQELKNDKKKIGKI